MIYNSITLITLVVAMAMHIANTLNILGSDRKKALADHMSGSYDGRMSGLLDHDQSYNTEVSKFPIDVEESVNHSEGRLRADFFTG
ncbi:hypothetical protein EYC87_02175 [Halieaceae bacterium IMCC8485]|jgi:hypothetical protein|uniref:Uncharacterized protein n=2 Tax=Candidatus Seongchinamella marina TaxID=2518990 RepID=A0ABT3SRX9_9GAMM|nr:hypothetical protein [Candidatus Seongchinamella marina]